MVESSEEDGNGMQLSRGAYVKRDMAGCEEEWEWARRVLKLRDEQIWTTGRSPQKRQVKQQL